MQEQLIFKKGMDLKWSGVCVWEGLEGGERRERCNYIKSQKDTNGLKYMLQHESGHPSENENGL